MNLVIFSLQKEQVFMYMNFQLEWDLVFLNGKEKMM